MKKDKRKPIPMKYLNHPPNPKLTAAMYAAAGIVMFIVLHFVLGLG